MTPQEQLHAVETAIRKELPRLMEVSEGCYFIDKTFGNGKVRFLHKCQRDNREYILDEDGVVCWYDSFDKEIIGHDILLSDVLEWDKRLVKSKLFDYKEDSIYTKGLWDLSKPRLADQSEDLWNFLYNLIKNN